MGIRYKVGWEFNIPYKTPHRREIQSISVVNAIISQLLDFMTHLNTHFSTCLSYVNECHSYSITLRDTNSNTPRYDIRNMN